MLHLSATVRYYFYAQMVDMRKGCYGLSGIVQNEMKQSVVSGDVFAFINKRHNKIKLLQWDKDGFALYEKSLIQVPFWSVIWNFSIFCRALYCNLSGTKKDLHLNS